MVDILTLRPVALINGTVNLPGSKSISNRALLLSALATGKTYLTNLLNSDDVRYMLSALRAMNINYQLSDDCTICQVHGIGKPLSAPAQLSKLFLGNAGTVMRPLTAALSLNYGDVVLTGEPRMKERPIGHLVDVLRQGGAKIDYLEKINYPPVRLNGGFVGGDLVIDGSISSQFLTSLLMIAPLAQYDTKIYIKGLLVSKPYINVTLHLMRCFGITVQHDNYQEFYIQGRQTYYSPENYSIEGDASTASYFLAAAAIKGGTVRVKGLNKKSMQGDIQFANVLENIGANIIWGNNFIECTHGEIHGLNMDMNAIPDAAMTLAIVALFATEVTTLYNIYNWRVKETDRLSAMATELRKVGAKIEEGKDFIRIFPPKYFKIATINTYNDHRIAMCFSLVSLSNVSVNILNPQCTSKTFPDYFKQFSKISYLLQ
ncbi:3-phosphoshikimate 1-carboxyvinyltransferase [Candidatus Ecksteinia adelgidicola]|nr:3-phosphoshikimate 1-carboxyvinyltransferase [Candidatus Ecksteinia adelgidicola]